MIQSLVKELEKVINYMDTTILSALYNTTVKNILLIVLALYSIFVVKELPRSIIELSNKVEVRIAVAVIIVYISRRHIDVGILLILAFYFTLMEARRVRLTISGDLEIEETTKPEAPIEVKVQQIENNMPFQQSKNPDDVQHPAHLKEDMAVYDEDNMKTCVAVDERDMCAGGLFDPAGYVANDFGNLANF